MHFVFEISSHGAVRIVNVLIKTVPAFTNGSNWGGGK